MRTLADKIAIVTGASSGIGRATALLFAREGAQLVVTARRRPELDVLVEEIEKEGGRAVAVAGDIRDEATAKGAVETALRCYGGLDIAFNNAGATGQMGPIADMSLAAWHDTLETNLTSAFLGAKYQAPAMVARGGGSLIFTGTFVGYSAGLPGMGAYAAAKAGLIGLVQVLAVELGRARVRANALLVGGTDTPASITNAPDATPDVLAFVENLHALKRMARPEEIAQSALYLASDASSFTTGSALAVDGGVSICRT